MPTVKKMSGGAFMEGMHKAGVEVKGKGVGKKVYKALKSVGREVYDVAAPAVKEVAREMLKQKLQEYAGTDSGKGLYAGPGPKGRGMRMKMSAAQVRTLKKGGAIQIKPAMFEDMGRYAMEFKPAVMSAVEKALAKNKGMRVSLQDLENVMDMKKGMGILDQKFSVNDVIRTGKELVGGSILDEKFSINDIKNTGRELFGRGKKKRAKKGAGPFEDFFTKTLPSKLVRQALPVATSALGGIAGTTLSGPVGSVAGAAAGKVAGQKLGSYLGDKYGYGLYAGSGMSDGLGAVGGVIQTGSPYVKHTSPAYHPFQEKYNPFT